MRGSYFSGYRNMRYSEFGLTTLKEAPAEAEIVSHRLMLRAGLIRRLASGLFTWMPLGLRVLRKVETVVREEMNRAGALELLMPAVQPAELWRRTGRWDEYGPVLLYVQPGSPAAVSGIRGGDVILQMAQKPVDSIAEVKQVLSEADEASPLVLLVKRGGDSFYVVVKA